MGPINHSEQRRKEYESAFGSDADKKRKGTWGDGPAYQPSDPEELERAWQED